MKPPLRGAETIAKGLYGAPPAVDVSHCFLGAEVFLFQKKGGKDIARKGKGRFLDREGHSSLPAEVF